MKLSRSLPKTTRAASRPRSMRWRPPSKTTDRWRWTTKAMMLVLRLRLTLTLTRRTRLQRVRCWHSIFGEAMAVAARPATMIRAAEESAADHGDCFEGRASRQSSQLPGVEHARQVVRAECDAPDEAQQKQQETRGWQQWHCVLAAPPAPDGWTRRRRMRSRGAEQSARAVSRRAMATSCRAATTTTSTTKARRIVRATTTRAVARQNSTRTIQ
jgi:hypothetical protein